jgi:hypothetical protein
MQAWQDESSGQPKPAARPCLRRIRHPRAGPAMAAKHAPSLRVAWPGPRVMRYRLSARQPARTRLKRRHPPRWKPWPRGARESRGEAGCAVRPQVPPGRRARAKHAGAGGLRCPSPSPRKGRSWSWPWSWPWPWPYPGPGRRPARAKPAGAGGVGCPSPSPRRGWPWPYPGPGQPWPRTARWREPHARLLPSPLQPPAVSLDRGPGPRRREARGSAVRPNVPVGRPAQAQTVQ